MNLSRLVSRALKPVALPLACYYAVTLVLPLANGAARSGRAFTDHALVVASVPLILIGLVRVFGWGARTLARAVPLRRPAPAAYVGGTGSGRGAAERPVPHEAMAFTSRRMIVWQHQQRWSGR